MRRILLLRRRVPIPYLLRDEFTTADDNPLTSPRNCEPGSGTFAFRDVEGKLAIASGWLEWTAQASAVYAEQDAVSPLTITRTPGRMLLNKWRCATDNPHYPLALVSSTTPAWNHTNVQHGFWRSGALTLSTVGNATVGPAVCAFVADGTIYKLVIIQRATGAYYLIKGGAFTNWTLLFSGIASTTTPLYAASTGYSAVFSTGAYRLPTFLWLPTPLLSTSGAMTWPTTDGLGHAEGVAGGLGAGGGGLTMMDAGTWSTAGGYILNTPVKGTEQVSDVPCVVAAAWTGVVGWATGAGGHVHTPGTGNTLINNGTPAGITAVVGQYYYAGFDIPSWVASSAGVLVGGWAPIYASSAGSFFQTGRAMNAYKPSIVCFAAFNGTVNNFSAKPIPNSSLFTNMQLSTTDVLAEQIIHVRTLGTQVGMILNADRSFAAKCAVQANAGQTVIALKQVTGVGGVGLSTNDTITVGGVTYTIASVVGGSNVAYNDTLKTQTITLGNNLGAQVNVDDKVGLDWLSWNGVLLYFDGAGNIKLDEVVAGVYTNRASTAVTFVADNRLICRKVGTEYRWFFGEVLIATTTAVNTAAMAGRYYGTMSTNPANLITSMVVYATGSGTDHPNPYANLDKYSQ